jgi:hypothetical protein
MRIATAASLIGGVCAAVAGIALYGLRATISAEPEKPG